MNKHTITLIAACTAFTAFGQISPAFRDSAVQDVLRTLTENYVFPETAERAKTYVLQQKASGAYNRMQTGDDIARQLTADIRHITHDLHINVGYSPEIVPELHVGSVPPPEEMERVKEMLKRENYGVKEKRILPGNIGYLNFKFFGILEFCADSLISAMQFISGTDALIIDLRENGGSMDPSTIPFLSGYFFGTPTHLNDFYNRYTNDTTQSWSYGWVPGKRYFSNPVYILTSRATFSGAEEFAYDFKNLKRATLIGEQTGGGANPGGDIKVNDHFVMFVPTGRAINPITKTNWEGVGVQPDTVIKANKALYKAQTMALSQLIASCSNGSQREGLQKMLNELQANAPVYKPLTLKLNGHANAGEVAVAGTFNGWSPAADKMKKADGIWTITIEAEPGKHQYKFIVDGQWITDPGNPITEGEGLYINSVVNVK